MYGLVNLAIEGLVKSNYDDETWVKICDEAGANAHDGFIGMDQYPDSVTYDLVAAAAKVLDTPAEDLLEAFGSYWIEYTAKQGYGDLLDMSGDTLEEFLENLDELHARVMMTFSNLQPPSFQVEHVDDSTVTLHYLTERPGLAPMVRGLLKGLASRFDTTIEIELTESRSEGADHDVFTVRSLAGVSE